MLEDNAQSKGNPEWGYKLDFSPSPSAVLHAFCGEHTIHGANCPNCNKPLLRLLSLNAADRVLNLDAARHPRVHLLYCWTCSIPYGEFSYRIGRDGSVTVLSVPPRKPDSEFGPEGPYDGYTGIFRRAEVALEPLSENEQQILEARHPADGEEPEEPYFGHQVGGYPLIYNPSKAFWPDCSTEMPLLASICNDAAGNNPFNDQEAETFTGNGGVQMVFHFCRACSIVTAYHSCD